MYENFIRREVFMVRSC